MKHMFIDETNVTESDGDFFIVGGLILDEKCLIDVRNGTKAIREKYGFRASDSFKFQTRSRPDQVSKEDFNNAKAEAIQLLIQHDAHLLVYVILHKIIREEVKFEYAYNVLFHQFDKEYLSAIDEVAFIIVDRLPANTSFDMLKEIFSKGVDAPSGNKTELERILHYSVSADGTSHMSSLLDIAIGAFRFCVNAISNSGNNEVASKLLPEVSKLIWSQDVDGKRTLGGYGFLKYPKNIKSQTYDDQYQQLVIKLTEWSQD